MNVSPKDLLDAGVHFGHQTRRWNPRSKPYVFDHRQGITIIDLGKTHELLQKAYSFLEETVAGGGNVLFVGCAIGRTSIEKVIKMVGLFLIPMLIVLLLITYVPFFSLALPDALGQ